MFTLSPQLSKVILAFLLLTPWFSLYQKILFPHLAQTGFDGAVITLVELIFIIFICAFGKHPKITKQGAMLLIAVSGWHISGFISAYLSDHFYPSLIKQIEYLVHCMFAYSVWVFLSQTQKQEKMVWFLIFTFVWMVYYILCAWHIQDAPYSVNWVDHVPFFNNIRHSGFILISIFPFLFLPLIKKIQHKTIISLFILSIYWGILIWSCSRGTYFASIISTILIYIYFKGTPRLGFILLSSYLIGWIIAFQFSSDNSSLNPFRLWFLNFDHQTQITINNLSSGRLNIWLDSYKQAMNHSYLFGYGPDGYNYLIPRINIDAVQPHSSVFQLLNEYGFVGLLAIFSILASIYMHWKKRTTENIKPLIILSRIAVLSFIIASIVDGHFYYNFSLLYFSILIALSIPSGRPNNTSKSLPIGILLIASCLTLLLKQHWSTYIEQQVDLFSDKQIQQFENFPSYYFPMKWLYGNQTSEVLLDKAIKLGQKNGPMHCNFYFIDFLRSNEKNQEKLKSKILENCSEAEILSQSNKKITNIINNLN